MKILQILHVVFLFLDKKRKVGYYMKTLFIYDSNGTIFFNICGDYSLPVGELKILEAEIPKDKIFKGIDVKTNEVILENKPKTQIELLEERLSATELSNAELTNIISLLTSNEKAIKEE